MNGVLYNRTIKLSRLCSEYYTLHAHRPAIRVMPCRKHAFYGSQIQTKRRYNVSELILKKIRAVQKASDLIIPNLCTATQANGGAILAKNSKWD